MIYGTQTRGVQNETQKRTRNFRTYTNVQKETKATQPTRRMNWDSMHCCQINTKNTGGRVHTNTQQTTSAGTPAKWVQYWDLVYVMLGEYTKNDEVQ